MAPVGAAASDDDEEVLFSGEGSVDLDVTGVVSEGGGGATDDFVGLGSAGAWVGLVGLGSAGLGTSGPLSEELGSVYDGHELPDCARELSTESNK